MANWWEEESSVQNMLEGAFKKALTDYGVAKSGEFVPDNRDQTIDPSKMKDDRSSTESRQIDTSINLDSESTKNIDSQLKKQMTAFTKAISLPAKAVEIYDGSLEALSTMATPVLDQYNAIQEGYGGLNIDLDKATGSSKAVIDRLDSMQKYYYDVGNSGTDMAKKLGFSNNAVSAYFEDEAEAFNESERVLGRLVDQHSQYINQLDEETLYKLPLYSKALGISSADVAKNIEIQINTTGKAQTTMLDDIAKFSQGLAKSTGVPLKSIAQNAVQITNDTQRMGDVTAEEATRIAATLGQLGQTYDSFTGVLDKFQEFGSSAETSGLISQITGGAVNLDAQQLMYLASEEQEKFLPELRRMFLAGNFTKEKFESLGKAEQRQMAAGLSMGREQFRAMLDTSREFDEHGLIDEIDKIAADKTPAAQALTDQLELAPKYANDSAKAINYMRTRALHPLKQDLLNASDEYSKLNANIRDNIDLTDQVTAVEGMKFAVQTQGGIAKSASTKIDTETRIGVHEFLELLTEGASAVSEKQNPSKNASPSVQAQVPPTVANTTYGSRAAALLSKSGALFGKNAAITPVQNTTGGTNTAQPVSNADSNSAIVAKLEEVESTAILNASTAGTNNEETNRKLAELTTALTNYNQNTNSNKEIILMVNKSELGRIMLDGEFIIAGEPQKIVKTETK